jgi:hypothetical protein
MKTKTDNLLETSFRQFPSGYLPACRIYFSIRQQQQAAKKVKSVSVRLILALIQTATRSLDEKPT